MKRFLRNMKKIHSKDRKDEIRLEDSRQITNTRLRRPTKNRHEHDCKDEIRRETVKEHGRHFETNTKDIKTKTTRKRGNSSIKSLRVRKSVFGVLFQGRRSFTAYSFTRLRRSFPKRSAATTKCVTSTRLSRL